MKAQMTRKILVTSLTLAFAISILAMEAPGYQVIRGKNSSEKKAFDYALAYITDANNSAEQIIGFLNKNRFLLGMQDAHGYTLLMRAAKEGRTRVVDFILEAAQNEGIYPSTAVNHENSIENEYNTALSNAAKYNHTAVVERLLRANPSQITIQKAIDKASRNPRLNQETVSLLKQAEASLRQRQQPKIRPQPVQPIQRPQPIRAVKISQPVQPQPVQKPLPVQPQPNPQPQPQPVEANDQNIANQEENECFHCLEPLRVGDNNVVPVSQHCIHQVHQKCLDEIKEKFTECPMCKAKM